ncbi:MAG: hypothetical protein WBF17_27975, partial [Phycisphaerae bacterium]
MRTALLAFIVVVAIAAAACAQPSRRGRPPSTRPAAARGVPAGRNAPDLAKGPVDPYDQAAERAKFFQAAGPDNELDPMEFAAAAG